MCPLSSMYFAAFSFEPSLWKSALLAPVAMSTACSQPSDEPK